MDECYLAGMSSLGVSSCSYGTGLVTTREGCYKAKLPFIFYLLTLHFPLWFDPVQSSYLGSCLILNFLEPWAKYTSFLYKLPGLRDSVIATEIAITRTKPVFLRGSTLLHPSSYSSGRWFWHQHGILDQLIRALNILRQGVQWKWHLTQISQMSFKSKLLGGSWEERIFLSRV